jgi:hypothetical protein
MSYYKLVSISLLSTMPPVRTFSNAYSQYIKEYACNQLNLFPLWQYANEPFIHNINIYYEP